MESEQVQKMPNDQLTPELQEAVRQYQSAGQEFIKHNPDFNELLNKAAVRGLEMSNFALQEIVQAGERGVRLTHYLVQPENFAAAKKLHDLKDESAQKQRAEIQKLLSWTDRHGHGLTYEPRMNDTDKYLEQRRADLKSGKRRR